MKTDQYILLKYISILMYLKEITLLRLLTLSVKLYGK